jgi:excisionase family DNA binding protein
MTGQIAFMPTARECLISLPELCEWLGITERHARRLVEREAIPYRKVGHLLRFSVSEIERWSIPAPRNSAQAPDTYPEPVPMTARRKLRTPTLPKSLIA